VHTITKSENETFSLAKKFSKKLRNGDVIALIGELGAGKSVFTRGLLYGCGITDKYIASPTFTLINIYHGKKTVYHFDVYRLSDPQELYDLGYEEYFFGDGITIIEWADKIEDYLPKEHTKVEMKVISETGRYISIKKG